MEFNLTDKEQKTLIDAAQVCNPWLSTQILKSKMAEIIVSLSNLELYGNKDSMKELQNEMRSCVAEGLIHLIQLYFLEKDEFDKVFTKSMNDYSIQIAKLKKLTEEAKKKEAKK